MILIIMLNCVFNYYYKVFGPLENRSFSVDDAKKLQKIALLPIASKFGPQEVNSFSQIWA